MHSNAISHDISLRIQMLNIHMHFGMHLCWTTSLLATGLHLSTSETLAYVVAWSGRAGVDMRMERDYPIRNRSNDVTARLMADHNKGATSPASHGAESGLTYMRNTIASGLFVGPAEVINAMFLVNWSH